MMFGWCSRGLLLRDGEHVPRNDVVAGHHDIAGANCTSSPSRGVDGSWGPSTRSA